jgi:hypothetical protein
MTKKRGILGITILSLFLGGTLFHLYGRSIWVPVIHNIVGKRTVSDVLTVYGEPARSRMGPYFAKAGVAYPPTGITLLGIKDEQILEVWAEGSTANELIHIYPIHALSGVSGPKLLEGDRQVPEGFYDIEGLNPNSSFHLSLKLDYPNRFDLKHAEADGRDNPGSNIFIHGKAVSIGCLAMGDTAIEELFVLAADVGKSNMDVAIAPSDPRRKPLPTDISPAWVGQLYSDLNAYFNRYAHVEPK